MEANPNSRYRPLFLIGEYNAIIDEKSRLLIVAEFRKEILDATDEKRLLCHVGRKRVLRLYPEVVFREMVSKRRQSVLTRAAEEDFAEAFYGMTFRLEWDAQGRVVLPELVLARTKLGREVCIIGAEDCLVVRNRADWLVRSEELLEKMDEITDQERDKREKETSEKKEAKAAIEAPPA